MRSLSTKRTGRLRVSVFLALAVLILQAVPILAELHEGVALIHPLNSWDFSESAAVGFADGDINYSLTFSVGEPLKGSPYWIFGNYPAVIAVSDTPYADLTEAPEDTSKYAGGVNVFPDEAYVVRTVEGHYAKFQVIFFEPMTLEYVYQDDGSRSLSPGTPTEPSTWGRIKVLYEM